MTWLTVTPPSGGATVSTSTFGIPVANNMAILASAWTAYTPTITTGGVAITLGNGTIDGAALVIGKTAFFRVTLAIGSTTSMTAGTVVIGLPVNAKSTTNGHAVGTYVTSAPIGEGSWKNNAGNTVQLFTGTTLQTVATLGLVSGSVLFLNGTYEAA